MHIWKALKGNEEEVAKEASAIIEKGRVVAVPTDTVYGLVADATNKKAIQRIFQVKGREKEKPLPIFVASIAMAKKLAKVSKAQEALMKKAWPGKVTFVLESKGVLPRETGTAERIGLRIPKHKLVQELLKSTKKPLTGTSANLAGQASLSDSKKIVSLFQGRKHAPDLLLHAGKLPPSRPSKVVDITAKRPKILRN